MIHKAYSRLLDLYKTRDGSLSSLLNAAFEWLLIVAVHVGARLGRWQFPGRAVGGWWWIWRWRWEVIVGWLEYDSVAWCRRLIKPGMTVVDIGAHIGYFTRLFSELSGPNGHVIAYEPCPENYPHLLFNLSLRDYLNVEAYQLACGDQAGSGTLFLSPGHSNHSLHAGYTQAKGSVQVEIISADKHLQQLGFEEIHFAKLDTEGSEVQVLRGMREIIDNSPSLAMLVELNPPALRAAGSSPRELTDFLEALGFVTQEIASDGKLLEPDLEENFETRNLLCLRPKHWQVIQNSLF